MKRPVSAARRCGWLLIGVGVVFNRWTLAWLFSPDGHIGSPLYRGLIHGLDLLLVAAGLLLVWAARRQPGWIRTGTRRAKRVLPTGLLWNLAALALVLAVSVLFFGAVEGLSYLGLRVVDSKAAVETSRRHALLGNPPRLQAHGTPVLEVIAFHPLYGWHYRKPGPTQDRYKFRLNRMNQRTALEPDADLRIFLLGGSTVYGVGLEPRRTLSAHLERILERDGNLNVNVVNAGVGGWSSINELAFLTQRILPFFDPDLVIVLDGVNDVKRAMEAGRKLEWKPGANVWEGRDGDHLYDPKLKIYQRQFRAMQNDPGYVLNQLLYTLEWRRYFQLRNYYSGALLTSLVAPPKKTPAQRKFREAYEELLVRPSAELSAREKSRARRRLHQLSERDRRKLHRAVRPFSSRQANLLLKHIAAIDPEEWDPPPSFRDASVGELREFLQGIFERFEPLDQIESLLDRRKCRKVPLNVSPYLNNVLSAAGSAAGSDVPVIFALQPTIFHKETLTRSERSKLLSFVVRSYTEEPFVHYHVPPRTCGEQLYLSFYEQARRGFRTLSSGQAPPPSARFLDLSDLFEGIERHIFTDYVHYNSRGNKIIARTLAREVRGILFSGPGAFSKEKNAPPNPRFP